MKTKYFYHLSLICAATALFCTTSCKKSKNETQSTGTFYFHIHTNIDTSEVDDTAQLYPDKIGRHFGLSVAQFYLSNITLQNTDGTMYTIPDAYILKDIDNEEYIIGSAPVGTYTSVKFNVGLDPSVNATNPSGRPVTSPLSNLSMWYGSTTQGYIFMKVQGFADTTAAQTGNNLMHFSYEIGSSANLKTVTMPTRSGSLAPYILTKGGTQYIHLVCDYAKLLSIVNFKTQDNTDSYSISPATATLIANNIPNMFDYEE